MDVMQGGLKDIVQHYPWAIAIAFFAVSVLINSQGAVVAAMLPLAYSLGIEGPVLLGTPERLRILLYPELPLGYRDRELRPFRHDRHRQVFAEPQFYAPRFGERYCFDDCGLANRENILLKSRSSNYNKRNKNSLK